MVVAENTSTTVSTSPVQFSKIFPSSDEATRSTIVSASYVNMPSPGLCTEPPASLLTVRVQTTGVGVGVDVDAGVGVGVSVGIGVGVGVGVGVDVGVGMAVDVGAGVDANTSKGSDGGHPACTVVS